MNGSPLLKCLSITFECTSPWLQSSTPIGQNFTNRHMHAHTLGVLSLRSDSLVEWVLFSWGVEGLFLTLSVLAILCAWQWEERSSGGIVTSNPAAPCQFFVALVAKQKFFQHYTNLLYSIQYSQGKKGRARIIVILAVCLCRSQTHDCNTQANRRLFLAVGFLVYVTVYEGAPQINWCQMQQKEEWMTNTQHWWIKKQKSVRNFKHKCQKVEGELLSHGSALLFRN